MSFHLTEDSKTLAELAKDAKAIVKSVHRTGRPVVVTLDGKPGVVILDAESFEKKQQADRMRAMLLESEADIQAGRTRPAAEFFKELLRGKKIPSKNDNDR